MLPVRNALVELWHADREGDYSQSTGVGRNAACDATVTNNGNFTINRSNAVVQGTHFGAAAITGTGLDILTCGESG